MISSACRVPIGRPDATGGRRGLLASLVYTAAACFALPGCLALPPAGPELTRDLVPAPEAYRSLYYTRDHAVSQDWLREFEDPVLVKLVEEAIERNYDLY